jgi:hypothetical protein
MKAKPRGACCHDEKKICGRVALPRLCAGMTVAIGFTVAHGASRCKKCRKFTPSSSFFSFFLAG